MSRSVIILGSAGSVGQSALDVVRKHHSRLQVTGLATRSNVDSLFRDIQEFLPKVVAIEDTQAALVLKDKLENGSTTKNNHRITKFWMDADHTMHGNS